MVWEERGWCPVGSFVGVDSAWMGAKMVAERSPQAGAMAEDEVAARKIVAQP